MGLGNQAKSSEERTLFQAADKTEKCFRVLLGPPRLKHPQQGSS